MYEITVTKTFCAAHAIKLPDGSVEPLHGHNWNVAVVVTADQLDEIETVMDFHDLQKLLNNAVAPAENFCLNDISPFKNQNLNPTAERVAWWIGSQITPQLPTKIALSRVCVTEAPGCSATYIP